VAIGVDVAVGVCGVAVELSGGVVVPTVGDDDGSAYSGWYPTPPQPARTTQSVRRRAGMRTTALRRRR
jgi:hypothetical protein